MPKKFVKKIAKKATKKAGTVKVAKTAAAGLSFENVVDSVSRLYTEFLRQATKAVNASLALRNRLPIANDYRELFPQIKPYLKNAEANTIWERYDVCVIGYAMDRPARPLEWKKEFSGKEIANDKRWGYFDNMERKNNPNSPAFCGSGREYFVAGEKWIGCSYAVERASHRMDHPLELPGDRFSPEKFRTVP